MSRKQDAMTLESGPSSVDLRPIRRMAVKLPPENSAFRRVISGERDSLSATEFVAKLGTCLSILDSDAR